MKKTIVVILSIVLIVCIAGLCSGVIAFINDDFNVGTGFDVDDINLDYNSILYYTDDDGNLVEYDQISGTANRIWADIEDVAVDLQNAFIAIEDERFLTHPGFDAPRLAKAVFNYVVKRDNSFGGSTITQQLVKNLTKDDAVRPDRKIREILRAIKLEQELDKQQILEMYLNTIYLSHGCYGVQSASYTYFGKDASQLNLAESACIAGITQYPSRYDPIDNPEANKEKQEIVLDKMLELGYITEEECAEAKAFELVFATNESYTGEQSQNSFFVDTVIDEVLKDLQTVKGYSTNYATKLLYSGGLQIHITLDPKIQNAVETVFTNEENFSSSSMYEEQPQSAIVIMDPHTGAIKGIYGQRGVKTSDLALNRATQTLRSPGSTIKPIAVYGPAVEEGIIGPQSVINDEKITIDGWTPHNYDNGWHGHMTIRTALEQSYNIPPVKVLQLLGVNKSYEYMTERFGFTSLVDSRKGEDGKTTTDKTLASLALGGLTDGVSVKEMCAAYSAYANDGVYTTPYTYTKVLDHDGNLLMEKNIKTKVAVSAETASIMTHMMQGVVLRGTGTAANLASGIPVAGKTGTSENTHDLWFCGYTPYYCGAVWYGFDIPKDMSWFTSGGISATLWRKVMNIVHEDMEYQEFETMPGVNYYGVVWIPGQGEMDDDEEDKDKEKEGEEGEEGEEKPAPDGEVDGTVTEGGDKPLEEGETPSGEETPSAPPEEIIPPEEVPSETVPEVEAPTTSDPGVPDIVIE